MKNLSTLITESFVTKTVKSMVDQLSEIKDSKKKLKYLEKLSDTHIQALFQELYPKENPNQSIKEKMEKLAGL